MFTATLRGMLAHKLRLVLTTASIALGVAFLAGTLILTDTMKLAFEQLFGKVGRRHRRRRPHRRPRSTRATGVGLSRGPDRRVACSTQVRAVDGVRAAEGSVTGYALLTDTEGKAVLTSGGAPTHGLQPARRRAAPRRTSTPLRPRAARAARGRHRRQLGREPRHPARLDHQGPVPRARPRSSPSSAPSASATEGPRRHHRGLLRHRDRAAGPGSRRHVRRDQRQRRGRRHRHGPGAAARRRACPTAPRR